MQEFMKFAKTTNGDDAREKLKELLSSGKMSKQQYEELRTQAEFISRFMKK